VALVISWEWECTALALYVWIFTGLLSTIVLGASKPFEDSV